MPGEHEFLAPSAVDNDHSSSKMTNADFRKMMMTPRAGSGATALGALGAGNTPSLGGTTPRVGSSDGAPKTPGRVSTGSASEKAEKRKKKKSFYAKLKRQEDDKMAELAAKYRDRAKERRDGYPDRGVQSDVVENDGQQEAKSESSGVAPHSTNSSGYRAVAPDVKSSHDAAERRRQMIQESKFLGGDMEHTHLVKGLDFALLQKVRSEINNRERATKEEVIEKHSAKEEPSKKKIDNREEVEDHVECRTVLAKNVLKAAFKTDMPDRNELFFPGRMAYIMDLEDEHGMGEDADGNPTSDIPTTAIRSKADVQTNLAHQQAVSMSANDIVINKLTQILSYLRAAGSRGKKKRKDKLVPQLPHPKDPEPEMKRVKDPNADLPIFDDVGDYVPDHERKLSRSDKSRSKGDHDRRDRRDHRDDRDRYRERDRRDRDRDRDRNRDKDRDRYESRRDRDRDEDGDSRRHKSSKRSYFDKREDHEEEQKGFSGQDKEMIKNLLKREENKVKKEEAKNKGKQMVGQEDDVYAECYPGIEMNDAMDDSDDEVDYTKMDLGNKKGPVGRWDFDTAEEYADYMSQKEAMPKAAFQYGVKMTEGRKTRGKVGIKNEKAKLDKEWNKISALIDKRKGGGPDPKKTKYE